MLRLVLFAVALVVIGGPLLAMAWVRTPLYADAGDPLDQPVEFDHRHHVRDDGIGCSYCHYDASESPSAGMPDTGVCMGCHAQIWTDSPLLEPVRQSWATEEPIVWRRVYQLPDFVYFNHAVHVERGVGCESCHGRVDLQARVHQEHVMNMGWCLECHRDPAPHLRPPELATAMGYETRREEGEHIRRALDVDPPTHCTACHR